MIDCITNEVLVETDARMDLLVRGATIKTSRDRICVRTTFI
jgi:hypothetical protein